ncbi:MAG: hypothetical protein M0P69_17410 [Bacteroidales bacterium]|nr:hypothetical protein [Bacteroidales bacterium]
MDKDSFKSCPFCAEKILIDAQKCKHCSSLLGKQATTVELTSKSIKKQMILSILAFIGGFFIAGYGAKWESDAIVMIGLLVSFGGGCSYFWAKIARWWYHG